MKTKCNNFSITQSKCEKDTQEFANELSQCKTALNEDFLKIDRLEQYGHRLNLEFEGISQLKDEKVEEIVVKLAKGVGVELNKSDISIAHRLPPKYKNNN